MMDFFRQGYGKPVKQQRRVDIGRGEIVVPSDKKERVYEEPARPSADHRRLFGILTALSLLVGLVLLAGCAAQPPAEEPSIQIESVRITAAGHYIDLRYRVLDPDKANASLGPGVKPTLIDDKTGAVMAVPMTAKLGSLRQTRGEQRPDRSYFVLFANTAGVRSGSSVTAQLGDMKFENLTIE